MRFYRITALILLLMFCLSFASTEGNYRINGKDLYSLDYDELYGLSDAVLDALYLKFYSGIFEWNGSTILVYVEDAETNTVHLPYCYLTLLLGEKRYILQSSSDYCERYGKIPCELCHPEEIK